MGDVIDDVHVQVIWGGVEGLGKSLQVEKKYVLVTGRAVQAIKHKDITTTGPATRITDCLHP